MRTILTLVRKDLANFHRNRAAVILTFFVPIALIYVFGQVFGLNRKDSGPNGITLAVVNASASDSPAAQKLIDALQAEKAFRVLTKYINPDKSERPLTEDDVRAMIHDRQFRYAVVIPRDLLPAGSIGLHLKILSDPRNSIEAQMVNGLLQKTIFSNVPELLGQSLQARAKDFLGGPQFKEFNTRIAAAIAGAFGGDKEEIQRRIEAGDFGLSRLDRPATPADPRAASKRSEDGSLRRLDTPAAPKPGEGGPAATNASPGATVSTPPPAAQSESKKNAEDFLSRIVKIDQEQVVGKKVKNPDATRVIGGQAIMFLLFALSGSAASFFDEKNAGLFQRLLSAPVTRGQLLWSRFLFGVIVGVVQLMTLFLAGNFMFGMDVLQHLGGLVIVCTAASAACTAFGMFVAAFSPNAAAASGLATLLVMMMSSTGGAWFPMSLMPEFMQKIGHFTLVYWSMEAFSQVLWADDPLVKILPTIGILLGIAVGVMSLSIWRLNRRNIFG